VPEHAQSEQSHDDDENGSAHEGDEQLGVNLRRQAADCADEKVVTTAQPAGAKLVTPGFPDHPSGHGCVSGAVVNALQDFFGTDKVTFTATSNKCFGAPCTPRTFNRFSDALKEVIDARVWSGIHLRTADVAGAVLGKKVAHYLEKHYFQPVG
jgi:hypothetical protein